MSDKRNLKEEYIELKYREAPDLWNRIESGLEERIGDDITESIKESGKPLPFMRVLAAAACLFVCVTAVYVSGQGLGTKTAETEGAAMAAGTTPAAETTVAAETYVAEAAQSGGTAEETAEGFAAVSYEALSLEASSPLYVPETVKTVKNDMYFSEAILADTELLCEGTVTEVSFDYDSDGAATAVSYRVEVKNILYSQDYVSNSAMLTVKSDIDDDAVTGDTLLYALNENRTYLLPLAARGSDMWLVFPFAPQIEVTKNQEYLFHNGWQSLVSEDSCVVLKQQAAPEDFYFDRMYLRKDSAVVDELVSLTEAMHGYGRNKNEENVFEQ